MSHHVKKRVEDIGLSPYALVFRGQKKMAEPHVWAMDFNDAEVFEPEVKSIKELSPLKQSSNISWVNVDGLDDVVFMQEIAETFDIPGTIMSDIMNPSVRPQVEEFDAGIFISIKIIRQHPNSRKVVTENLSLILCEKVLISFREVKSDIFDPIRDRIIKHKNIIRTAGVDYLAFALLDIVIDNYIYIVGLLDNKIDVLDEKITRNELNKNILDNINAYKRELNHLRRAIKPSREMILSLAKMDSEFIHKQNKIHFKELQDNVNDAAEQTDNYREMLYDQLTIYHTSMSTRLNDVIKILTIFSVLFIPLTFIVGVYGTNFDFFPELKWRYGYFGMWGVMIIVAGLMLWFFRKKKWI